MMQQIRDGLKGPVIYVVLGLIVGVPFAFSGIQGYLQNSSDPVVAKVGNVKITQAQLRNAFEQRYRQLQQLLGDKFRADQFDTGKIRAAVLRDMVQESLLRQYARDTGYRTPDSALRDYLMQIPAFQDKGHFSRDRYQELLRQSGQDPVRFEAQSREALMIEQVRNAVMESAFVTPVEAAARSRIDNERRDFGYLKFDPAKYLAQTQVSDADIIKQFDADKARYQAPEQIRLSYVELSVDALAKAAAPTQEMLKTLYESEKASRFTTPEVRHAAHILVTFGADKAAAKKKVDEIYEQLKNGGDFAALARSDSQDPGSKDKGGDLGTVRKGDKLFPDQFEEALFALAKPGDYSAPVETEFGWHIVRLVSLQPAETKPFDDAGVQKALTDEFEQTEARKRFQELSDQLEEKAFDNPASLDPVAKDLGLKVETTDWFTRAGGAGISANRAVATAAFSSDVLSNNENSKPIAIDATHLVVVRKADYRAARPLKLEEVTGRIRDELKQAQARKLAQADADSAIAALNKGEALADVAKNRNLPVQGAGPMQRNETGQSPALLEAVFRLPRPADGKLSVGEATLDDGSIAVIALSKIEQPAVDPGTDAAKQALAQVRDALAGADFSAYSAAIEKQITVDLKPLPKDDGSER